MLDVSEIRENDLVPDVERWAFVEDASGEGDGKPRPSALPFSGFTKGDAGVGEATAAVFIGDCLGAAEGPATLPGLRLLSCTCCLSFLSKLSSPICLASAKKESSFIRS